MTDSPAVAVYDEELLKGLEGMVDPRDVSTALNGPDQLKINYDEDSVYPRGAWVLGQKKNKEGKITEQGHVITHIVILTTRFRWSFYDENTKTTVSTLMFEAGSQPPNKAECDAKAESLGGQLKFQVVIFGLAIVEGVFKEFVSYQGGTGYGAFKDYLKELVTVQTTTKRITVPPFAHVTILKETEKKKNGSITYWIPVLERGQMMTMDQLQFFGQKRDDAYDFIVFANNRALERKETISLTAPVSAPSSSMYSTGDDAFVMPPETPKFVMPDVSGMKSANATVVSPVVSAPVVPAPVVPAPAAPDVDDYDIEAAMRSIINEG